ncbi:nitronate monooxygenase [Nocardioides sp. AE5]|uniref:nitronate monooxygenase n=1 Tax=Nocardioides sp. AE5 TaxID=2962573 RepID=UPI002881BA70|nr:nitronate monooxygenase [Nocardioides sp. AE5]MDT0201496.1 nitronate monooxygenase [Nocardioides sp. AE5]
MTTALAVPGLAMASPVMVAAGCGGTGPELDALAPLAGLGAFVTRTVTLDARLGGPPPRLAESPSGFINAIGLQNPGIDQFLARELPWLAAHTVPAVVSVAGASIGEYAAITRRLAVAPGVAGVEVNVSVPDGVDLGLFDASEPFAAARAVSAVRRELPRGIPVLAKLAPEAGRVAEFARAVAEAGADAVVVGNAVPAVMPQGRPGGLSGPAIAPLALRCVAAVREAAAELPVIAAGGVQDTAGARAFLDLGAVAVQVGTALLHDPTVAARIAAELQGETR